MVLEAGSSLDLPSPSGARDLEQRRLKAQLIVDGLKLGGVDAMAVGGNDWALGGEWVRQMLTEAEAPVLAANLWCGGERPWPGGKVVEAGGKRVGVVGVTVGNVDGCEVRPAGPAIAEALAALGPVDLRVALVPARTDREVAVVTDGTFEADLLLTAVGKHSRNAPDEHDGMWAYSAGTRGKHLGILTLEWSPGGESWAPVGLAETLKEQAEWTAGRLEIQRRRLEGLTDEASRAQVQSIVTAYEARVAEQRLAAEEAANETNAHRISHEEIELAKSLPEDPATRARIDETLQAIRQLGTGSAMRGLRQPHRMPDNATWAGSDTCASCHRDEHAQWAGTRHANAWQTLVAETREMDTQCFSCHATGAGQEAGPAHPTEVGPFRDVQCEACHGPAKAHVMAPTEHRLVRDPGEAVCTTCHDGVQDAGRFDFETYRPKIVHGDGQ